MVRLILSTVGDNPLTSAIILSELLKDGDQVVLIATMESYEIASRIAHWMNSSINMAIQEEILQIPAFNYQKITQMVNEYLTYEYSEILVDITGGTKIMSLGLVNSVDTKQRFQLFYLQNGIIRELNQNKIIEIENTLSLSEILFLYNWQFSAIATDIKDTELKLVNIIASIHQTLEGGKSWYEWRKSTFLPSTQKYPYTWKDETELSTLKLPLPSNTYFERFVNAIPNRIENEVILQLHDLHTALDTKTYEDTCNWINGKWLEIYVYSQMRQIKWIEISRNLETKFPMFEIDIVAKFKNSLIIVSCTTITDSAPGGKSRLKSKMFEVIIRARQLGGLKTYPVLVCMSDDLDTLKNEFRNVSLDLKYQIFGRKDLVNLKQKIENWIETIKGE